MIALLVGSTLVCGLVVGWYGYRTLDRIQKWGEKMNELDAIFQGAATAEEMAGYQGRTSSQSSGRPLPVAQTHLPIGLPR